MLPLGVGWGRCLGQGAFWVFVRRRHDGVAHWDGAWSNCYVRSIPPAHLNGYDQLGVCPFLYTGWRTGRVCVWFLRVTGYAKSEKNCRPVSTEPPAGHWIGCGASSVV